MRKKTRNGGAPWDGVLVQDCRLSTDAMDVNWEDLRGLQRLGGRTRIVLFGFRDASSHARPLEAQLAYTRTLHLASKATGAHRLLTPRAEEIFDGFACDEYCNRELHLDNAFEVVSNFLSASMDESTACRYLNRNGFSLHRALTKRAGFIHCQGFPSGVS
jgi:hypothetical protein